VQRKFELLHFEETILPDCPTIPVYLIRYAVDGQKTPYFWASKKDRVDLGDEVWFESLKVEAEAAIAEVRSRTN